MALTWTDINSRVNDYIVPELVDEVYKSSPVFIRLDTMRRERFEGGLTIKHPITYTELNGGAFTRGDTFDTSYVQTDTALQVNIKYLM